MNRKYEDMLDMPHHQSDRRPHMSLQDRAAQFSPFAALVGYGDAVLETARLTDRRVDLDEQALERLDEKLRKLQAELESGMTPVIEVTRFVPDARKEGGSYETTTGTVIAVDGYRKVLRMENGREIPVDMIVGIDLPSDTIYEYGKTVE